MKHLIVDISAHGFGHLAQTAVVLNALDIKNIRLTIRSLAPAHVLRERIRHPFDLITYQQDNGVVMHDALRVDADATMRWYQDFHASYAQRRRQAAMELKLLKADLVFADVPYLSLDAAGLLGVPAIALCSLNWADIFDTYCGHFSGARQIHTEILNAYAQADLFLQATPSMPMQNLSNTLPIAPIALKGSKQAGALHQHVECKGRAIFILVSLGGIGIDFSLEQWPALNGVYWIFPDQALYLQRDDFFAQSCFDLEYIDLLSSCDLVVTKTGYGTQTEAVINRVPAFCVRRAGWPEQPYLFDWHKQNGDVVFIDWSSIQDGSFADELDSILKTTWSKQLVMPDGGRKAAEIIMAAL